MPTYRNGNEEYRRKPKMKYEMEYEPEWEVDEEEEECEEKKHFKKPCFCKFEFPFKVLVKVVPICDEHKRPYPM